MENKKVLIICAPQNMYFIEGESSIPNAEKILPTINSYITRFQRNDSHIIFIRDYSKNDDEESNELQIHPSIFVPKESFDVFVEETIDNKDAYHNAELDGLLEEIGAEDVYVCGVGIDTYIKHLVEFLTGLGLKTYYIVDGCIAVDSYKQMAAFNEIRKMRVILERGK